jgi:predicted N-acyltransferase
VSKGNYVIRVLDSALQIDAAAWNGLLARQAQPTPFLQHAYLAALERSGSATPSSGWTPRFVTLWDADGALQAACPLYLKSHSRGEYVFDWSWADAYQRHGLAYYPKAVVAVPYTPVPGSRLLARDAVARAALLEAVLALCRDLGLSSLHLLFGHPTDLEACQRAGLMLRHTVQFHWTNRTGTPGPYADFDDFLADLNQDKRKKIRQERRKVQQAGVTLRHARGADISAADWDFFYRCYERTYLEHGNPPYLSRAFFAEIARTQPGHWLLFIAEREGRAIASSLIAVSDDSAEKVAWGRYWGALERVDCLHFEACYYSPLQWCITHGYQRFEGGAQGEHKLARALLPVRTDSAHWLAHPDFAQAVEHFLAREGRGMANYLDELAEHTPLRRSG